MTNLLSKLQHLNIHRSLTGQLKKKKDNYLTKNSEATKQKRNKNIKLALGHLHFINN